MSLLRAPTPQELDRALAIPVPSRDPLLVVQRRDALEAVEVAAELPGSVFPAARATRSAISGKAPAASAATCDSEDDRPKAPLAHGLPPASVVSKEQL